jgi:hypothetical protein
MRRAKELKDSSGISDKKLGKRFNKSIYWVRKTLEKSSRVKKVVVNGSGARKKFAKINDRVAGTIDRIIEECESPLQIPYL